MKKKFTLLAFTLLLLMSCNDKDNNQPESIPTQTDVIQHSPIENTKWVISRLHGTIIPENENKERVIHFILDPVTKSISGNAGCNSFTGAYTISKGNQISFSNLATTRMMCPDFMVNEKDFLEVFKTADNFNIYKNQLMLNKAKRSPLAIFKNLDSISEQITEKHWKLIELDGAPIKMAANQEREIFFSLKTDDNRVTGFAGCNSISGTYQLKDGNGIHFTQLATTLKMCPDVTVNESAILNVFNTANHYIMSNDKLYLNIGNGTAIAVFEAVYF